MDTTTDLLRVAIVDDDPTIRTVVRLILASSGRATLAGEAEAVDTGASMLLGLDADVVLLDHNLGRGYGTDLIPLARNESPRALVAVLTSQPADEIAALCRDAGAHAIYDKVVLGKGFVDRLAADLAEIRRERSGA